MNREKFEPKDQRNKYKNSNYLTKYNNNNNKKGIMRLDYCGRFKLQKGLLNFKNEKYIKKK